MYHQFNIKKLYDISVEYGSVFFLWISEQTAIISLYEVNVLIFITETECLLRGTNWVVKYNSG